MAQAASLKEESQKKKNGKTKRKLVDKRSNRFMLQSYGIRKQQCIAFQNIIIPMKLML